MPDFELYRRLREAVDLAPEGAAVEVGLRADKRIVTLTGRVPSRCVQISIEDAVARIAPGFTVVNRVAVEPQLRRPAELFQ